MYVKANNAVVEIYPYSITELRLENRQIEFPAIPSVDLLAEFNVFPVKEQEKPEADRFSYPVRRQLPELLEGEWVLVWDVLQKSSEQIEEDTAMQIAIIRDSRNEKLNISDWTQLADAPLTAEQKQSWINYRQDLRDIPAQAGFPWEVIWPEKPEGF